MNKRIRQLAREAGFYANPDVEKFEKFAELIVRECAELCLKHETFQGLFNEMEYRKGRHFSTMMKEHFGVES